MRIVTRPDFDGVVCAVLLYDALKIEEPVKWVEPNFVQRGLADIREGDVIANLPFDERCSLWFDHHFTNRSVRPFEGVFRIAPSAAGLIFEHYKNRFKRDYSELAAAADKIDSAFLTMDEVLHPESYDYVMLSMTVSNGDRTNEPYWNKLVDLLGIYDIRKVLDDPDVKRRCRDVIEENARYAVYLKEHTHLEKQVAITDFRKFNQAPTGNRFLVYSLFPESIVNVRISYADKSKDMIVVHVGHSIFNPHCNVNAGLLLSRFEGGGHRGAASARFQAEKAGEYLPQIIDALLKNENNEAG
jgi:oligoribonuclease NrnB/cAMP/cGMP phosphodiesterase (DHH superfamily)